MFLSQNWIIFLNLTRTTGYVTWLFHRDLHSEVKKLCLFMSMNVQNVDTRQRYGKNFLIKQLPNANCAGAK